MQTRQSGFTLIEIAIVLVIIGLLLGGVLKGQELINSARVKNFANDFRQIPVYIYSYQDRFRALPGDDGQAATRVAGATNATTGGTVSNGSIEGRWDSQTVTDESVMFWQHIKLAGLAPGDTAVNLATLVPRNADGGILGVQSISTANAAPIAGMTGSYAICSRSIQGRFAVQLDVTMDDGNTATGSIRVMADVAPPAAAGAAAIATATVTANAGTPYTVCLSV